MSLQSQYKKFADTIALTRESDKYKEARKKDDLITPKVENALKEEGYEIQPNFLQGSLATSTGVIPLDGDYDIDRALAITESSSPDNPLNPKKIVKKVLSEHGFKDPLIKRPCVTADYQSKPLHIDYPIYRINEFKNYQLAVGKENSDKDKRIWDDSDPKGLVNWITSNNNIQSSEGEELSIEQKSQFYRIVRYIKRWRDNKYDSEEQRKKVFSIALTVMFKESFTPNIDDDGRADDHAALKGTLETILDRQNYFLDEGDRKYRICVYLPVTPTNRDIFDGKGKTVGTTLRGRLRNLKNVMDKVDNTESLIKKSELLQKEFGDDFPVPDKDSTDGKKSTSRHTSATAGVVGVSYGG